MTIDAARLALKPRSSARGQPGCRLPQMKRVPNCQASRASARSGTAYSTSWTMGTAPASADLRAAGPATSASFHFYLPGAPARAGRIRRNAHLPPGELAAGAAGLPGVDPGSSGRAQLHHLLSRAAGHWDLGDQTLILVGFAWASPDHGEGRQVVARLERDAPPGAQVIEPIRWTHGNHRLMSSFPGASAPTGRTQPSTGSTAR
jgi:hypothetical protein